MDQLQCHLWSHQPLQWTGVRQVVGTWEFCSHPIVRVLPSGIIKLYGILFCHFFFKFSILLWCSSQFSCNIFNFWWYFQSIIIINKTIPLSVNMKIITIKALLHLCWSWLNEFYLSIVIYSGDIYDKRQCVSKIEAFSLWLEINHNPKFRIASQIQDHFSHKSRILEMKCWLIATT